MGASCCNEAKRKVLKNARTKPKMKKIYTPRSNEIGCGHKQIPLKITDKIRKCLCKIIIKLNEGGNLFGTGFFMIYDSNKYLITCYHVINSQNIDIDIEIWNNQTIKFVLKNYDMKYIKPPSDITIIKIKKSDEFINDIEFLDYDSNYFKGNKQYLNLDIFSLGYPNGNDISSGSGKILGIDDFEFDHNIDTEQGSSGSPIILFNTLKVIGIHKQADKTKKINIGIFIGEVIKKIKDYQTIKKMKLIVFMINLF